MIVPMKKIFLVTQDKHQDESLKVLRSLGVVHLERRAVSSDALTKLLERKVKAETALRVLKQYVKVPSTKDTVDNPEIVNQVLEYVDERKSYQEELIRHRRERSRIEEWGDFDPKQFSLLSEQSNTKFFLYKLPSSALAKLPEEQKYIILGGDKNFTRLLALDQEIPGRVPFALSEYSCKELDSFISGVEAKLADIEGQLKALSDDLVLVEKEISKILSEIEFESARAKLNVLEDIPAESSISWINGFVPQEDLGLIKRGASENGWALLAEDPGPDDAVPTKLKNNRLVNLLNPLLGFLNITPGYNEVDISGWFLLFFTIYFGMIFGDAGYGALFLIISIAGIFLNLKKGVPIGLKLLLLLGSSNFIWGVLTCTWFGLAPEQIPVSLQQLGLPLISNVTAARSEFDSGIVRQNLMIICFSLALIQLSIGHMIAITKAKSLRILAELGSISMLLGMYGIVLSLIASNESRQIPLLMPCVYLLGIGFVFVFVFSGYKGSIGGSILDGFKNIISMILGIANVFSDIMSYIRLWAVGLAGAAISSTVVAMAGPMLGNLIFFVFGIIVLVFGHGLNLALNALSVLVHGVRLNTLEFSGHVGLTWAGTAYKPFKDQT